MNIPVKIKPRAAEKDGGNHHRLRNAFIVILIIIIAVAALAGFITDCMWFSDLGYSSVFWKKIVTMVELGVPIFVAAVLLVRLYLRSLKNGYFREIESHEIPDQHRMNLLSWALAGIFGLIVAIPASSRLWMKMLQSANASRFGLKDPIFNLDIGFYVFRLNFLETVNGIIISVIFGLVIITLIYYGFLLTVRTPDVFEEPNSEFHEGDRDYGSEEDDDWYRSQGGIRFDREEAARRVRHFVNEKTGASQGRQLDRNNLSHLFNIASGKITILGVLFYAMLAIHFFLKQFDLLHAHTGVVYGAGFTDVNVTLWLYRVIIILSIVGAVTLAMHMRRKEYRRLIRMPVIIVAVGLVGSIAALAVQSLVVSPDEINKETKYLNHNIRYTRHAYDLDQVQVKPFKADSNLDAQAIADNSQTISNIRINDYEPVKDFYNQTQSIRQYYDFNDVDIDRYKINGEETQTYLSAREINEKKISNTWINKHIKYTHGYGGAVSQVDAVTASGQPDVIVKNIPPKSSVQGIKITRPEIYFGESTNDYIVVNTDEPEFDYPDGNNNKYTKYKGSAGIKLNPINKLLFAIREHSMQLLVSSNVNSNSKIIFRRNVEDRIKTIMPYLSYENDPYMTEVNGRLYWIVDAYTTSSKYPYSEPYSGEVNTTNYIRNSIKVVVDAYNGDVNYYVVDKDDPIAETYMKIYPKLFKSIDKMPSGLRAHIRYPNDLFKIQADVYTKYHMNETRVFYQKEDLWDIAHQIYGTKEKEMDPSYYIFKLPNQSRAEFINMVPFTPKSKQNMTAIMMARNDGKNYGKLLVYKFPKNKTVYGPMQVEAQIDQNTEISKEFSLWNSAGSTYRRGDMFVIPINNSIMYVEPVYLEASNQAIPEVKRVIVAFEDRIAYQPTLGAALDELFGEGSSGASADSAQATDENNDKSGGSATVSSLIDKANEAYDNAVEAQKNGDWKSYGEYLDELKGYLSDLEDKSK